MVEEKLVYLLGIHTHVGYSIRELIVKTTRYRCLCVFTRGRRKLGAVGRQEGQEAI